jgi:hypothetical protein
MSKPLSSHFSFRLFLLFAERIMPGGGAGGRDSFGFFFQAEGKTAY